MQDKISKDMTFGEIMKSYPKAAPIMAKYGLHCIGCHISETETISEGAAAHGLDSSMFKKLMTDLNQQAVQ